jgi:hypothetical protein
MEPNLNFTLHDLTNAFSSLPPITKRRQEVKIPCKDCFTVPDRETLEIKVVWLHFQAVQWAENETNMYWIWKNLQTGLFDTQKKYRL